jgi:hypothetical protein
LEVDDAFAGFTDSGGGSTDCAAVVGGTGVGTSGTADDVTTSRISRGKVSASAVAPAVVVGVAGCLAALRGFVLSRGTDVGGALDGALVWGLSLPADISDCFCLPDRFVWTASPSGFFGSDGFFGADMTGILQETPTVGKYITHRIPPETESRR